MIYSSLDFLFELHKKMINLYKIIVPVDYTEYEQKFVLQNFRIQGGRLWPLASRPGVLW